MSFKKKYCANNIISDSEYVNSSMEKKQHGILILFFIAPFLVGIGIDLYVPSLPGIVKYFKTTPHLVQLTIALYILGYGIGQLVLGLLSDSMGRKKILVGSAAFFALVSLFCVFSSNIYFLNAGRFFQGFALAGMGVVLRAMASDSFKGMKLSRIMSYIGVSWALGPIVGPFIGGYIDHYLGWQSNFYLFSLYGLVIAIYVYFTMNETNKNIVVFEPFLILKNIKSIFSNSLFLYGTILMGLLYGGIVIFNTIGPFIFQETLNFSPIQYGYLALILGIAYCLGTSLNAFLIKYFPPAGLILTGLVLSLTSSISMTILSLTVSINMFVVMIPVFLILFSFGLVFPNILAKCMETFSKIGGTASAVMGLIMGFIVFFATTLASKVSTVTQVPLSVIYLSISVISLLLFLNVKRRF